MRLAALLMLACAAFAQDSQQPNVVDANLQARASSGDLKSDLRAASPTWFGYAIKSRHVNESCCDECRLEGSAHSSRHPVPLDGSDIQALLFRVTSNGPEKLTIRPMSCSLDAGGLPFVWLTGVSPAESLSFLKSLTDSNGSDHLARSAVFAISQHEGPAATTALEGLAHLPEPARIRSEAIFWLAQQAGNRAASLIKDAIENDPDTEVKKKAVFALSQLPKDEGVPKLIEVAQENRNREVRKQAFFWLGQSNDPRALAFIEQVLAK
ncbi:MAG: HEAT repeat domain-containing protein [Acidobacteriaceae bacterium]|nr:HEAT repeat domain-containing protein [Acidobacteriaceae bacterium]